MATNFPKIKLSYFNIEGSAEKVRLALVAQGIPFEDQRITFPEWAEVKSTAKFGQVPLMYINDGNAIGQSYAMLRYVGRLGTIYFKFKVYFLFFVFSPT